MTDTQRDTQGALVAASALVEANIVVGEIDDDTAVINTAGLIADVSELASENATLRETVSRLERELPCDVQIPGTKFRKGVKLSTVLAAIDRRAEWPDEDTRLPEAAERRLAERERQAEAEFNASYERRLKLAGCEPKAEQGQAQGEAGQLRYRPLEFDDWGIIRNSKDDGIFAVVSRPIGEEEAHRHRAARTDPFEPLARILMGALTTPPSPEPDAELVEALERIKYATPENTSSRTAKDMSTWTFAVAATALARHRKQGGE